MIEVIDIDETCLNNFKPGYANTFIEHFAKEFDWTGEFTRRVTRDAIRFLVLSAIPPAGSAREAQIMVSSRIVDKIVDAIFLDTPLLVWLERNVLHTRIHHVPVYAHGVVDQAINDARYDFTVSLMRVAGYELDREIWPSQLPENYRPCSNGGTWNDCLVMAEAS